MVLQLTPVPSMACSIQHREIYLAPPQQKNSFLGSSEVFFTILASAQERYLMCVLVVVCPLGSTHYYSGSKRGVIIEQPLQQKIREIPQPSGRSKQVKQGLNSHLWCIKCAVNLVIGQCRGLGNIKSEKLCAHLKYAPFIEY